MHARTVVLRLGRGAVAGGALGDGGLHVGVEEGEALVHTQVLAAVIMAEHTGKG